MCRDYRGRVDFCTGGGGGKSPCSNREVTQRPSEARSSRQLGLGLGLGLEIGLGFRV